MRSGPGSTKKYLERIFPKIIYISNKNQLEYSWT